MSSVPGGGSQRVVTREKIFSAPSALDYGPTRRVTRLIAKSHKEKKSSSPEKVFVQVSESQVGSPPTETVEAVGSNEQEHTFIEEIDAEQFNEDNLPCLTGKLYFDIVLSKSHVSSWILHIPQRIANKLPRAKVATDLICHGHNWRLVFIGDQTNPRFDIPGWRSFVKGMNLAVADACVFELVECSNEVIRFRVIILKNKVPPQLLASATSRGSPGNPIEVD